MFFLLFSIFNVDFLFLCEVMFQPLLAHRGPTHTVQNVILHLHVNKMTTDDTGEYTGLSTRAQGYVDFEQQRSEQV